MSYTQFDLNAMDALKAWAKARMDAVKPRSALAEAQAAMDAADEEQKICFNLLIFHNDTRGERISEKDHIDLSIKYLNLKDVYDEKVQIFLKAEAEFKSAEVKIKDAEAVKKTAEAARTAALQAAREAK
eukprot:3247945-Rhodomonas_salina.1